MKIIALNDLRHGEGAVKKVEISVQGGALSL